MMTSYTGPALYCPHCAKPVRVLGVETVALQGSPLQDYFCALTHDCVEGKPSGPGISQYWLPEQLRTVPLQLQTTRPEIRTPKLGVTAVIRNRLDQDQILLGLKARAFTPELLCKWVTPGGRVNYGESLEDAIKREVREETGLECEIVEHLFATELIHPTDHFVFIVFEMLADGTPRAGDDLSDLRWFDHRMIDALRKDMTPLTLNIFETLNILESP